MCAAVASADSTNWISDANRDRAWEATENFPGGKHGQKLRGFYSDMIAADLQSRQNKAEYEANPMDYRSPYT